MGLREYIPTRRWAQQIFCGFAFLAATLRGASASVTVLIGEPFGSFGTMMPVGHTTIYLDRACADGPLKVRMCQPGEAAGVALARYDHLGTVDWVATPILDFLYATEKPQEMLPFATPALVDELRTRYRHEHLELLFPDGTENQKLNNEWVETVGVAYDRRLFGYQLDTTEAEDQAVVDDLNARENVHRYHLHKANCADFAAELVNLYFPNTVKAARVVDFAIMSPKQVARAVERFGTRHPERRVRVVEIEQIPGALRRSRPVRFGSEALLKTKRYMFTLVAIQPEAVLGLVAIYVSDGRWKLGRDAEVVGPEAFSRVMPRGAETANAAGGTR